MHPYSLHSVLRDELLFEQMKYRPGIWLSCEYMRLRYLRILYLIFFFLTACAASPQPQEVWTNQTLSGQDAQARLITDRQDCDTYAASLAPYPAQMGYGSSYPYMQAYLQAKAQRKQYFDACMHQRGWSSQTESSQQKENMK